MLLTSFLFLFWFMLVLTYSFSFFGGDILFRIYCVKLSIGISRIITVVVKERFEMMRRLWRSMLVSPFLFFLVFRFLMLFLFNYHKAILFKQTDKNNY